jgi:predicted AlkP superfamily pyrophosphatase or phosphodiesterase
MLPALKSDGLSLADVFPSCLAAIQGGGGALTLPAVRAAVVLLVDGLGSAALRSHAGHARVLSSGARSIDSGFPTTTAAAIATLTTGSRPGQHGLVGYTVLDAANDRIINQLSGWEGVDPEQWQGMPTVFERARDAGLRATAIGQSQYAASPFTRAVLRGADYVSANSLEARFEALERQLAVPGPPQLIYLYVPELDKAAHAHGLESTQWIAALESLDSAVGGLRLPRDVGMIVTADHGIIDIPAHQHILYDTVPELMAGVAHVGGEPRCLQLYFAPDADIETTVAAWRESESERSWVLTRQEAIEAGWFGEVRDEVVPRIGDLLVAARKSVAYYASTASTRARAMVGQHGSWSAAELQIPLVRLGAFAPGGG